MILRLRHIHKFRDRHGVERCYLRRRGCKLIPLPPQTDPGFLAAYQAALAQTTPTTKRDRVEPQSLEHLSRLYLTHPSFRALGDSTKAAYRRIIRDLIGKHGTKPVRLLDAKGARTLLHAKAATPSAGNHMLRTLRAMVRVAIEQDWIATDPTRDVRRLREKGQGAATWTEKHIAAFEARWPSSTKPRLALALLLYTGQRRSDIVRMGRQHLRSGGIEVQQVKTGTRLLIPVHEALAAELAACEGRLTFLTTDQDQPIPYTPNGFYMRFRAWCDAAGLPAGLSPHGLRKAAARRMAESGCTAHQIASVTGHRTLSEVQRYTIAADQERLAVQAIARIGGGAAGTKVANRSRAKVANRK